MKKGIIIGLIVAMLAIAFTFGVFLYQNNTANIKQDETKKLAESINETKNEIVTVSTNETKISPNANIIYQTRYNQCGHIIEQKQEVSEEMVNLNETELQEKYEEYQIKQFNPEEVILYKEEEGICKEHYILRDYNGYIAIYNLESNGKENLQEITNIVTSYLPDIDIERLNIGIRVVGKQELNSAIEDYE